MYKHVHVHRYKGIAPSMFGIVPYLGLSFACYDQLKGYLPQDAESKSKAWYPWAKLAVGACSGVYVCVVYACEGHVYMSLCV